MTIGYTKKLSSGASGCTPYPITVSLDSTDNWRYRHGVSGAREQKRMYYSPGGDSCNKIHQWVYYLLGAGGEERAVWHGRQTADADTCNTAVRRVVLYPVEYLSAGGAYYTRTNAGVWQKEFRVSDHLGSIRAIVTNSTPTNFDYDAFGKAAQPTKRWSYLGREKEFENTTSEFGFRKYDEETGSFMQPDPLWAAYPSESPYRYGHNAPLNYSDASGLEEMQEIFEGCPGISYDDGGSGGPRYTPMDVNPLYEIGTDQGYLYDHPGGVTVVEDDNGDILVTYTGLASPLGPGRATTMRMPGIRSTLKTPEAGVTIEGGGYVSGKANGNTSGRAGTMMGQEVSSIHGRPTGIHGGGYNDVNNDGGGGFSSVGPAVGGDAPRGFLSWLSRLFTRFSWKSAGALSTASALTNASVIDKLQRYVLNFNHPSIDAKSKAKWFKEALGYTLENMEQLAKQIVFNPNTAVQTKITEHGIKYNQVIPITGANGRTIDVVFAWIKNNDGVVRFVTAIPTQKGK